MQAKQIQQEPQMNLVANTIHESANPLVTMSQARTNLNNAKKSRLMGSNSAKYNAVLTGIDDVIDALNNAFTDDANGATLIHRSYGQLLHACKVYNSKSIDSDGNAVARKAFFAKGRARQDLVSQIEKIAKDDYTKLNLYFDRMPGLPQNERATNALDALRMARTANFKLKGTWAGQKHLGGNISDLALVKEGDLEDTNASGLFKKEEVYTVESGIKKTLKLFDALSKKMELKPEEHKFIYNELTKSSNDNSPSATSYVSNLKSNKNPTAFKYYQTSATYHNFVDTLYSAASGQNTMREYMLDFIQSDAIHDGDMVNLSKLNVASSRLASLLGQGHLVAQSELATLEDSTGNKINGIMMQKAEGKEAGSIGQDIVYEAYKKNQSGDMEKALLDAITPEFQKSLADLQVLDTLFGQVDRHTGNYMAQSKDGKLTGLTAIDNDFAFGSLQLGDGETTLRDIKDTSTIAEAREKRNANRGNPERKRSPRVQHLRFAADDQGNMLIPHMSDSLATAISQLKKPQLDYALADVLTSGQLKALWTRVQQMQVAIENERKKPDSKRFLKDNEWNQDTLNDFMKNENYIRYFVQESSSMQNISKRYKYDTNTHPKLLRLYDRLKAAGVFKDAQSTYDFLTAVGGTTNEEREYLLQSGTLADMLKNDKERILALLRKIFVSAGIINPSANAVKKGMALYPQIFEGLV